MWKRRMVGTCLLPSLVGADEGHRGLCVFQSPLKTMCGVFP